LKKVHKQKGKTLPLCCAFWQNAKTDKKAVDKADKTW